MVFRLDENDSEFQQKFAGFLQKQQQTTAKVQQVVADILSEVKSEGDKALFELTKRFDNFDLTTKNLRISEQEIEHAYQLCDKEIIGALELAHDR
ncbi:hypothetical protein MNBD_ALPHA11-1729, partial [hydrothermal vent metagenome]